MGANPHSSRYSPERAEEAIPELLPAGFREVYPPTLPRNTVTRSDGRCNRPLSPPVGYCRGCMLRLHARIDHRVELRNFSGPQLAPPPPLPKGLTVSTDTRHAPQHSCERLWYALSEKGPFLSLLTAKVRLCER